MVTALQQFNEEVKSQPQFEPIRADYQTMLSLITLPGSALIGLHGPAPTSVLPPPNIKRSPSPAPPLLTCLSILDIDELEMARQITISNEELFGELRSASRPSSTQICS